MARVGWETKSGLALRVQPLLDPPGGLVKGSHTGYSVHNIRVSTASAVNIHVPREPRPPGPTDWDAPTS